MEERRFKANTKMNNNNFPKKLLLKQPPPFKVCDKTPNMRIPKQLGWSGKDNVDWFDNVDNYDEKQCLSIADFVSDESKTLEEINGTK